MALFPGEELVSVDTPNGPVMLPKSVASGLALPQQNVLAEYGLGSGNAPAPPPPPPPPPSGKGSPKPPSTAGGGGNDDLRFGGGQVRDDEIALPVATSMEPPSAPLGAPDAMSGVGAPVATSPMLVTPDFRAPPGAPAKGASPTPAPAKPVATQEPSDPFAVDRAKVDAATAQGVEAEQQIAEAKAAGATGAAQAYKSAAADQQRIMDDYRQSHVETQAKIAEADDFIKKNTQKIADAKIDRTHDHETMAFIGIALTGLGNALAGKGDAANPAIDMYFKSIDRKVKAQMDELDRTGKIVGLTQQQVDNLRKGLGDNKMLSDFLLTAQTQRHANILNQIAQTTSSDVVKAEALKGVAALNQRAAEFGAGLTEKKVNRDIQREQMATQIKTANISAGATLGAAAMHLQGQREQIASNERIHQEQNAVTMANKIAELRAKGEHDKATKLAKAEEENVKGGIGRIGVGDLIYNKEGQAQIDEASKLEQEAKALDAEVGKMGAEAAFKDPKGQMIASRANALKAKAADLRVSARTTGVWRIDNPETKREVVNQYTAANNISKLSADIIRKYDQSGGKAWIGTNEGQAEVQTMIVELLMAQKEAWKLGVLSAGEITQLQKAGLEDPTRAWDRNAVGNLAHEMGVKAGRDPEAFKAQIKELASRNEQQVQAKFQAYGFTGNAKSLFVDYTDKSGARTPGQRAAGKLQAAESEEEQAASQKTSTAGKLNPLNALGVATGLNRTDAQVESDVQFENRVGGPKWKERQQAQADLIREAKMPGEAGANARKLLVDHINAGKDDTVVAVRENAPELLKQIMPQLDESVRPLAAGPKWRTPITDIATVASSAVTDNSAYQQLADMAKSDARARALLADVNEKRANQKLGSKR